MRYANYTIDRILITLKERVSVAHILLVWQVIQIMPGMRISWFAGH